MFYKINYYILLFLLLMFNNLYANDIAGNSVKMLKIDRNNMIADGWISDKIYVTHIDSFSNSFKNAYGYNSKDLARVPFEKMHYLLMDFFCPNILTKNIINQGGILLVINRENSGIITMMIIDTCKGYKEINPLDPIER